ncbi:MAG: hypothetical protein AB7R89_12710 [Dehalococcoidia bacterium]
MGRELLGGIEMATGLGYVEPSSGSDSPRSVVRYDLPRRLAISAFILFHIVATIFWVMPQSALRDQLWPRTGKYIGYLGLYQSWGMFAPEPSNLNLYLTAVVTYQDGSRQEWTWPRMAELDLASRYQKERYRKFAENAHLDAYSYVWPSMARFAAEVNANNPANPPVHVQLWRHWWLVPPPPTNGDISQDPPHEWNHYMFFETPITEDASQSAGVQP